MVLYSELLAFYEEKIQKFYLVDVVNYKFRDTPNMLTDAQKHIL